MPVKASRIKKYGNEQKKKTRKEEWDDFIDTLLGKDENMRESYNAVRNTDKIKAFMKNLQKNYKQIGDSGNYQQFYDAISEKIDQAIKLQSVFKSEFQKIQDSPHYKQQVQTPINSKAVDLEWQFMTQLKTHVVSAVSAIEGARVKKELNFDDKNGDVDDKKGDVDAIDAIGNFVMSAIRGGEKNADVEKIDAVDDSKEITLAITSDEKKGDETKDGEDAGVINKKLDDVNLNLKNIQEGNEHRATKQKEGVKLIASKLNDIHANIDASGKQHHPEFNQGDSAAAFTEKPYSINRTVPRRQTVDRNKNLYSREIGDDGKAIEKKVEKDMYGNLLIDKVGLEYFNKEGDDLNFGDVPSPGDGEQTLRAQYLVPGSDDLVLTEEEQLRGDVEFDLFSEVKPGFGLGEINKLHLQNEAWEKDIRFSGPLYTPSRPDGPEMGARPVRPELHRAQTASVQSLGYERLNNKIEAIYRYISSLPGGSTNSILPDDNNSVVSSQGLKRRNPSPLIPVIDTHMNWRATKDLPGFMTNNRKYRKLYDPRRDPWNLTPYQPGAGGPTYNKLTVPMLENEVIVT
jgi:hypothetical protein